jgi:polysaccharide deacetylase family protein (PEP-CTERM system associated)
VRATFFTLGWIAERYPELIEEIVRRGHEISSHGYSHLNIFTITKDTFEFELTKSINVLSKLSGEKVLGFRAPFFSINRKNLWTFEIMRKYLKYDSSVFPVKFHYELPDAPRSSYRTSIDNPLQEDVNSQFVEVPLTTLQVPLLGNLPVAGGIYLRFLPQEILKLGIKKFNELGLSAIIYIHPKDLDKTTPRIEGYAWHNYWGLQGAMKKFESLLRIFRFDSIRDVLSL